MRTRPSTYPSGLDSSEGRPRSARVFWRRGLRLSTSLSDPWRNIVGARQQKVRSSFRSWKSLWLKILIKTVHFSGSGQFLATPGLRTHSGSSSAPPPLASCSIPISSSYLKRANPIDGRLGFENRMLSCLCWFQRKNSLFSTSYSRTDISATFRYGDVSTVSLKARALPLLQQDTQWTKYSSPSSCFL